MKTDWKVLAPPPVIVAGLAVGAIAVALELAGNPANMGLCMACFQRDIAGALGLHRAAAFQYLRPEIPAMVLGAAAAAGLWGEFRRRAAAAPAVGFVLGAFVMIGALVFLGCPTRMTLRLAGGDFNAAVGLAGFAAGVVGGSVFLRRGYCLGRATGGGRLGGLPVPLLAAALLALVILRPGFVLFSSAGPGSMHAAVWLSVAAGLAIGFLGQRSRLCFAGGIRDLFLIGSPHLLVGLGAVLAAALAGNLVLGQFNPGFAGQPAAHTRHLWNFLGMYLVGTGSVLLGGCPFRQVIQAAQGDGGAFAAVAGMFAGAAVAHNFGLAAGPAGVPVAGQAAVVGGIGLCLVIGWTLREA